MRHAQVALGCAGAILAAPAGAQTVYENITDQAGAFSPITNFDPNLAIVDDLRLAGGGELDQLTFTYTFTAGFGGPSDIVMDLGISLLLDDGDGNFNASRDRPLFAGVVAGLPATNGEIMFHTLDLPTGIVVRDGSTIWFATSYATDEPSFVSMGQALYNDHAVGTTDRFILIHDMNTGLNQQFEQFQGEGVGAVLTVTPAPATLVPMGLLALCRRRR